MCVVLGPHIVGLVLKWSGSESVSMCGVGSTETLLFYSSFMSALKPCLKVVYPHFRRHVATFLLTF